MLVGRQGALSTRLATEDWQAISHKYYPVPIYRTCIHVYIHELNVCIHTTISIFKILLIACFM